MARRRKHLTEDDLAEAGLRAPGAPARAGSVLATPMLPVTASGMRVPWHPAQVIRLQGAAGNASVVSLLRSAGASPAAAPAAAPAVAQRQAADEENGDDAGQDGGVTRVVQDVPELPQGDIAADGDRLPVPEQVPEEDGGATPAVPAAPAAGLSSVGPGFVNGGRTGTVPWGEDPGEEAEGRPQAFTAGGRTGSTPFAGGGDVAKGAHVNQLTGTIQAQVPIAYESKVLREGGAEAWVGDGTGTMSVVRSYMGTNAGDQGNGYYVTPAAAARLDVHEQAHINAAEVIYNEDLKPMLDDILAHTKTGSGAANAFRIRSDGAAPVFAIEALETSLGMPGRWLTAISKFQADDYLANRAFGLTDTVDSHIGYPVDVLAGVVGGTHYQHRIKLPTEPDPADHPHPAHHAHKHGHH